ncbi:MAG TPA: site-specific DNA-methyltransferase [Terriglobia bacterium]|nr:site-specific DNA-methyltransferase [Terriglobia bacterium]
MAKKVPPAGRRPNKGNPGNGTAGEKVKDYRHEEKRPNNPPAGLATYDHTLPSRKIYDYDPHLDPQLVWAGKKEHTSFDVENVALHIHERISTAAIIKAVQREPLQRDLFADPQLPLTQQIEFYQHEMNWANRLILGDSLLVMNSLLERELMAGKVQMIYIDPPYGVKFSSNFQPRIDRRDVKDSDEDLTREPEMIKAYRDTWTLGIHSYLTYLRDRLLLCRELLADSGSIFVQISDENLHYLREVMQEVFGAEGFVAVVPFVTTSLQTAEGIGSIADFLVWFAKDRERMKYRQLFVPKEPRATGGWGFNYLETADGTRRPLTTAERKEEAPLPLGSRLYRLDNLTSQGSTPGGTVEFEFRGSTYHPGARSHWKTTPGGMNSLAQAGRIQQSETQIQYVRFFDDFPVQPLTNLWTDTTQAGFVDLKLYVVQTVSKVVERCLLMTTDPGDLVLDPTCGSGTTAYVAEQWGRRWISCDTSRVALALARQRILTATFPYYKLAHPDVVGARHGVPLPSRVGVSGGFIYKTVPHVTLRSIAQNEPPEQETLYDQPEVDRSKVRVSGPFTVEAIPVPAMEDVGARHGVPLPAGAPEAEAVAAMSSSPTAVGDRRYSEGRVANPAADHITTMIELLRKAGVNFPGGKKLALDNLRPLGVGWLHAEAEARQNGGKPQRVAVSFGPRHGPISAVQTEEATRTARANAYDVLILAGFSIDAAAQDFIQKNPLKGLVVHFANVNPDVLVGDLLKTSRASQLFTVFGSPDVKLERVGAHRDAPRGGSRTAPTDEYIARLLGVDIYDPNTGELQQSRGEDVAAWFLDQDYDGYTFCISQAFFPSDSGAWEKLERALKGTLDPEKFEALRGTVSLPFQAGEHKRVAVKVIDMRGNEVIRVMSLGEGGAA